MNEVTSRERGSTTEKITRILEILKDGQWHMFNEVQNKTKLDETQLKEITSFLREYEFIILNETKKELKLEESARRFLT